MNPLLDILKAEGKQILNEFKLASTQGKDTPQEIADFRENVVQAFLSRYYPQSHIISKGKITDMDGNQSNSIDCLILNPAHPHLVDAKGKFRLIFADGCDAAIEVKPDLGRQDELERALAQCISAKITKRSMTPLFMSRSKPAHIVEHSLYIPFYVFCVEAFETQDLYARVVDYYRCKNTPLEHQIDGICVVERGIVKNAKHKEMCPYALPPPAETQDGWYFESWGDATPLGLLLSLENSLASVPPISEPIMRRILRRHTQFGHVERLGEGIGNQTTDHV